MNKLRITMSWNTDECGIWAIFACAKALACLRRKPLKNCWVLFTTYSHTPCSSARSGVEGKIRVLGTQGK